MTLSTPSSSLRRCCSCGSSFCAFLQGHVQIRRYQLGDAVDEAVAIAEHATAVAHHRLGVHAAEGDDLADLIVTIGIGHVIDHPVAIGHAEVDVEIRHRHALGVQETLEQQFIAQRIQIGDVQRPGHHRAGAGAAPGTDRDVVVLRPQHKVGNDEEVTGKAHVVDDFQLKLQAVLVVLLLAVAGDALILQSLLQPFAGLGGEKVGLAVIAGLGKSGQGVLVELQFQIAALGDQGGVFQHLRHVAEQRRHFF